MLAAALGLVAGAGQAEARTGRVSPDSVGGFFELVNPSTGKCADVNGGSTSPGAAVIEFDCRNTGNQLWAPTDLGNGFVQWHNRNSGLCLWLPGLFDNQTLTQLSCNAADKGQWWRWASADSIGHLNLVSGINAGGWCMTLWNNQAANGTPVVIRPCNGTPAQWWRIDG